MSRNGKIARLPRNIRDQLNHRLEDGESGVRLVEWLNALPEVRHVLAQEFTGRPINEQNLTEWKQGGFLTWIRARESCEWVRLTVDETDRVAAESGPGLVPLSDRLSATVALALGKAIHELSAASLADPQNGRHLLLLMREFTRVRHADHQAARLRMDLERYDQQQATQRLQVAKEAERAAEQAAEQAAQDKIARERTAIIEEANRRYLLRSRQSPSKPSKPAQPQPSHPMSAPPQPGPNQAESNQIKPNRTAGLGTQASEEHDSSRPP
jgi:hypothetical protein